MIVDCQMDGLTHAIGTVIVGYTWHDAAVGFAITCVFLESDVTATTAVIGDKKDEVLSYLSVHHVSILVGLSTKTTIMKVAGRIEIGVCRVVRTTGTVCSQHTCLPR